ncbi:MAG: hypothetical protein R3D44_17610 [Hyphomicrobiaceae bacterium]
MPGPSRREVLVGSLAGLVAASPAHAAPPLPVVDWLRRRSEPPFRVPDDFVGLHSDHGLGKAVPPPTYPYDAIRSHDTDDGDGWPALQWARIEREPGRYDWTAVDRWIAAHPGRTRVWVLFGCPSFYQKYPGEPWRYPYLPGGGSPPRNPIVAAGIVRALLARHPGQIHYVELWNEPNFGPSRGGIDGRWPQYVRDPGFFTGSARDLATLARVVKSALPEGVRLMAGAWEGQSESEGLGNSLVRFSNAPDDAGGVGRDHIDALSVHHYTYHNDPNSMIAELRAYRRRFAEAGYAAELPLFLTEVGAEAPKAWSRTAPLPEEKRISLMRWLLIPAALGISAVYLYKHSSLHTLGDPAGDPLIGRSISEARSALRGRTVIEAAVLKDESVWLSFTDGTAVRA